MTKTPKFQIGNTVLFRDEIFPKDEPEICKISGYEEGDDYPYRVTPLNGDECEWSVACEDELSFVTDPNDTDAQAVIVERLQTLLAEYEESLQTAGPNDFDSASISVLRSAIALAKMKI